MKNVEHAVILGGPHHFGHRAPPTPAGIVLRLLPHVVRQAVLMRFEGRTRPHGRPATWLERAADIRFVGISGDDETALHFEAPTLGDAAEAIYRQKELWKTRPDPTDTGFDLLGDVICDVRESNVESDRFDTGLLRRLTQLGKAIGGQYDHLSISGHRFASSPAVFDDRTAQHASEMARGTPPSNRVRVVGILDMIRANTEAFAIKLEDGQEVQGVVAGGRIENLPELFQKRVLVLGTAIYRPSGTLLRVDAEQVSLANGEESLWSRMPVPNRQPTDASRFRRPQGTRSGLAAIIGKWPGDEPDQIIEEAMRQLS